MIRPTGRCLGLFGGGIVAAALPTLTGAPSLYVVWIVYLAVCGAALAAELLWLPTGKHVRVQAELPAVVGLGDAVALGLHVHASRRTAIEVQFAIDGDVDDVPPMWLAGVAEAPVRVEVPLRPQRRGTATLQALHLRWTGPLRLLWCEAEVAVAKTLQVVANVRAVRARSVRMVENREFSTGLKVERYLGDGTDFDSLREYVVGMDRRAIDWKATARHREVLCREYRAERDHAVMVCLDTGRLMGEPLRAVPRLDHAMLAALQLAYVCLRTGDRVGMFAFADQPQQVVLPQSGVHALQVIQERLTALDYSTAETNYTLAMTSLLQQLRRRTLVVLFTDFVDGITAELMLRNVAWLARRHLLLFVAMRDPLLADLAGRAPRSSEDVHRSVVAAEIDHERRLVLERIRAAGAMVLDCDVERLEPGLVQHYLQVKRRELL